VALTKSEKLANQIKRRIGAHYRAEWFCRDTIIGETVYLPGWYLMADGNEMPIRCIGDDYASAMQSIAPETKTPVQAIRAFLSH